LQSEPNLAAVAVVTSDDRDALLAQLDTLEALLKAHKMNHLTTAVPVTGLPAFMEQVRKDITNINVDYSRIVQRHSHRAAADFKAATGIDDR